MENSHIPVLKDEILRFFEDKKITVFVDGTLGAGGHAREILNEHPEITTYVGIDQDPTAFELAKKKLEKWKDKVSFQKGNFSSLPDILKRLNMDKCDGILLDLGVSSMQIDQAEKGFSFSYDGPLDMRMNPEKELTAEMVVNTYSENELGVIFREYGEESRWRSAARTIVKARESSPIKTTKELVEVLYPVLKPGHKKKVHPLTLVFQALRIYVNGELEVLKEVIPKAIDMLNPNGVLTVISYHSLEDRIVKNVFRYEASDKESTSGIAGVFIEKEPSIKQLTRKPVVPKEEELLTNPRSRSAKLRVVEKL